MILVITGQQRSGTTMLRYFCNSHPDIAVTHEFGTFLEIGRPYAEYATAVKQYTQTVDGAWGYVRTYPARWQTRWHNRYFTWRYLSLLRHASQNSSGTVQFATIESTLKQLFKGATIVGDKLPQYRLTLPQWVGQDGVRCLLIYRDCRDVTSSFLAKKRSDWQDQAWAKRWDSVTKIAQRWVHDVEHAEQLGDDAFVIRYETLVTQPAQVIPDLARWLGVSPSGFDTSLLKPSSIGKYKQGLTAVELEELMAVAGPTLSRLGYL